MSDDDAKLADMEAEMDRLQCDCDEFRTGDWVAWAISAMLLTIAVAVLIAAVVAA